MIEALSHVVALLKRLEIRHYVGGSVASSFHGAVRSTMDVDIVCEFDEGLIAPFLADLPSTYYSSEPAIRSAVRNKSSFNLIHLPTSFKLDIFVSRRRPFDLSCMRRSTLESLAEELDVAVATAEDVIIAKLEWYDLGNQVSERQWDDVSKLIHLLGEEADVEYLRQAAQSVGVADLLDRLLAT